ncbi:MAG: methionyl-tRNA formyltransferase [Planctomycetota bacterium]
MKIVFFGTSGFALPALAAVDASMHQLVAVVTTADRPSGRGRKMTASEGKEAGLRLGVPVLQPEKLNESFRNELKALSADIAVVASYGKIIPAACIALFPHGMINIHPSLLPKYRGPSPVQQPILNGDAVTGVTIIKLTAAMDAGPIMGQTEVKVGPNETAGQLHDRLAALGAEMMLAALADVAAGRAVYREQDHAAATFCGKITKADGLIRWDLPADDLVRLVRAMTPWPGAFSFSGRDGRRIIIARAEPVRGSGAAPGTVIEFSEKAGLVVACGGGALRVASLAPAGSRKMTSEEYARGARMVAGDRLVDVPPAGGATA